MPTETVIKPDHEAARRHLLFTDEHEDLRDSMEAWVRKELHPHRNEWEDTLWPTEVMRRAGELGYLGLCFPEEYGGQGGDYYYSLVRAECMSYSGSGGTNMAFAVQTDMALPPIHLLGTEEQKQRYLVPGIKGEKIGCLGITEPGAGSDVAGDPHEGDPRRRRVRDQRLEDVHHQRPARRLHRPRRRRPTPTRRTPGSRLFVVDLRDDEGNHVPGFTVSRELEKMGMHASDTGELAFEEVRVPAENMLGQEGKGFYHISWELQGERLVAAAGCHAGAERMFERTLEYAKEREAFGRPIGSFQAIRHKFAEMATKIEAAKQFTYATAWRYANGEYPVREITMAKLYASRICLRGRRRVRPDPRRLRLHEGVRDRARLPRRPPQPDRRRHRRDHARRDRPLLRALARPSPHRPVLSLVPTDEEVEIRAAVRGICESFGGPEYQRKIIAEDARRPSSGTRSPRRATSASTCPSATAAAGSACTRCRWSARRSPPPAARSC